MRLPALALLPLPLALAAACGGTPAAPARAESPSPAAPPGAATPGAPNAASLDADGVQMLFPSAPGASFRLGAGDPNATPRVVIERGTRATPGTDGAVRFWNLPSYPLTYSSGGDGWTSRVHVQASGAAQRFTWRTQQGFLSDPTDLRNQEFTVYVRVHGILDPARAMVTLKIRGGAHTDRDPDLASCTMMTFAPANAPGGPTRFGKELRHPDYDYVRLTPAFDAALRDGAWVGLKLVSYADPADARRVVNRLYVDVDPFDRATGRPRNGWRALSEYVDVAGRSTGRYATLADWGGWQTTLRTDGYRDVDVALLSVREIVPPR